MTNTYELTSGKHAITIISNRIGQKHGTNRLIIAFLSIELVGNKLEYWTGRIIKKETTVVKLEPGRQYEHIFEGIKISSNDQKTFYIEI